MDRFNISLVTEGLTTYAIERQNGFQRQQPPDGPPRAEQRRIWTDSILQSMARLEGKAPDLALMERYDQELSEAKGRFFIIPAAQDMQRNTILYLRAYLSALEDAGGDRRLQAEVVQQLLEDMASHLHWACADNGIDRARDDAERVLRRMTARMPVRFTCVLLGGDAGPYWVSGFVSGCVRDAEGVKATDVYEKARRLYPEVTKWPALCTTLTGGNPSSAQGAVDASEYDLKIMNQLRDRFLKEPGIRYVGAAHQMIVSACEHIQVLKVEPGKAPEYVSMPNTLKAMQDAVGGCIEAVGLDCGAVLIPWRLKRTHTVGISCVLRRMHMEKIEITLSLDGEKQYALDYYLKKENTTVQRRMDEALKQLYESTVPEAVREYLDAKTATPRPKRPPRPSTSKAAAAKAEPLPAGQEKEAGV